MISLLVAMDKNRVIGFKNDLPWHLPNDLKFFKQKTTGNTIIMGRKTYESIGKPLPNRKNVVLTGSGGEYPPDVDVISDVQSIQTYHDNQPEEELFVIGGANVFRQVLSLADRMYITFVDDIFEGDTFFPPFPETDWELTKKEKREKDKKNPYDYYFLQYDRK